VGAENLQPDSVKERGGGRGRTLPRELEEQLYLEGGGVDRGCATWGGALTVLKIGERSERQRGSLSKYKGSGAVNGHQVSPPES